MPNIPSPLTFITHTPSGEPSPLPYLILFALSLFGILSLLLKLIPPLFSPLRLLPHPQSPSWIWGNMLQIFKAPSGAMHEVWERELGPIWSYREMLSKWRLCTTDPRALAHILTHAYAYPKPSSVQRNLARTLGEGLLVAEGETHKRQRRIMNPSFSPQMIRDVTPIFWDKAGEMVRIWEKLLSDDAVVQGREKQEKEGTVIDATHWLSRATLDIIGLAGFGYSFEALTDASNPLSHAFAELLGMQRPGIVGVLIAFVPGLRWLPFRRNTVEKRSGETLRRIGMELVRRKKAAVRQTLDGKRSEKEIGRSQVAGRDVLTALVRANMANDLPLSQRMDDEEVLAQISTFLFAGYETTSTAVTWALFAMCQQPEVQEKLRQELLAHDGDQPDMDQLSALPYLDAFTRELLRFHSPVPGTARIAEEDDEIPVSRPYVDARGKEQTTIKISKGDGVFIPIRQVNRSPLLWGEDAGVFKPERWLSTSTSSSTSASAGAAGGTAPEIPDGAAHIPGIWSHVLSFLGGPRACIGYRFSVVEIKVFLFALVRTFEFELADKEAEWEERSTIVSRPHIKGRVTEGPMLPLGVRRVGGRE